MTSPSPDEYTHRSYGTPSSGSRLPGRMFAGSKPAASGMAYRLILGESVSAKRPWTNDFASSSPPRHLGSYIGSIMSTVWKPNPLSCSAAMKPPRTPLPGDGPGDRSSTKVAARRLGRGS